jgi:hypothetical protein
VSTREVMGKINASENATLFWKILKRYGPVSTIDTSMKKEE